MNIELGLFDHCVLQRTGKDVCDAVIQGVCAGKGEVLARVRSAGKAARGFGKNAVAIGQAARGRFKAQLKGLPVGGLYEIELSVGPEKTKVRDVLVGDVWLLAGQSNMEGNGLLRDALPTSPKVRAFAMDDHWGVARDPLHWPFDAVDEVHAKLLITLNQKKPAKPITGVGPGMAFAQEMLRHTRVPQGLIACAHGGTTMEQWDPAQKKHDGSSLYGALLRRFVKNGSRVAGLLWYQGESDALANQLAPYVQRMTRLIRSLRKDLGNAALPVVMVQISRTIGDSGPTGQLWNAMQEMQRRLPETVRHLAVVPSIDLPLDDDIHISATGHKTLGPRLADAMCGLIGACKAKPQIQPAGFTVNEDRPGHAEVHVKFANVVGKLKAPGRPVGFALGRPLATPGIFDVKLAGSTAIIRTYMSLSQLKSMSVHYGIGADPVCNIVDEANRSLPVFGPMYLSKPRALTSFIRQMRVSDMLPSAGKPHELPRPALESLPMKPRTFGGDFCDIHMDVQAHGGGDALIVFACRFQCPQPMRLKLEMGYDGPVKAWIDQDAVFHDPSGTNPAKPTDKGTATFEAAAGEHELIVALGTNNGSAWGVFLRFERLDVSRRQLQAGPLAYQLPALLG